MLKAILAVGMVAAPIVVTPAAAQTFIPDVIGMTIGNLNRPAPKACYDGRWAAKPKDVEKGKARAEALMQKYKEAVAGGPDLKKLFAGAEARWRLDGWPERIQDVHDPWISKSARLELVAITVGNRDIFYHVQWRAYAADGSEIGLYDALLNATGTRFKWLDLYSPDTDRQPAANTPFCYEPGDVEVWQGAKAMREVHRATLVKKPESGGKPKTTTPR